MIATQDPRVDACIVQILQNIDNIRSHFVQQAESDTERQIALNYSATLFGNEIVMLCTKSFELIDVEVAVS